MKIKEMSRDSVDFIHKRLVTQLNLLADELGLSLDIGRVTYSPTSGTFKSSLVLTCETADGMPTSFESDAVRVGLDKSDWGRIFNMNGKQYEIVDVKPRNRKYPIIGKDLRSGKNYKFTVSQVKTSLDK